MKPLAGLRVIDLTQAMAAPFCTMNLADMGADVIKVEPPGEGESMRQPGRVQKNGHSATFMTMNRNKRSLALDLKQPEGVEVIRRLAKTADVFVQNYRPGVAGRLGVDFESLQKINSRLVYCAISGFGATGPYAPRGGYDLIAQGMSGIISVTGDEDGPPAKSGIPLSDLAAGLFGAYGILCALEHRERTGEGQFVDTSLLEAAMALTVWESAEYWTTGGTPKPMGSAHRLGAPYQALRAKDGYFTVGAGSDKLFAALSGILGFSDRQKQKFAKRQDRMANRPALIAEIEKVTGTKTRAEWLAALEKAGVPAGPINDYAEALADPHTLARQMVVDLQHPGAGAIKALGVPVKLSDTPGAVERAAPLLGEHSAEILEALCYSGSEQRALRAKGVIQ
jgi:crotonobetainyl-CoA:carnitine CoA-transferase CaiB-like acyl-CoA transferase